MEQLLTVQQFADRIGVHKRTAYRIVAARQVDWTDVSTTGRPSIRVSERALKRYVDSRTEQGSAA